jgi:hypothetical protein
LFRLPDVPLEESHAAEPEVAHERPELDGQLLPVESGDQQLPNPAA